MHEGHLEGKQCCWIEAAETELSRVGVPGCRWPKLPHSSRSDKDPGCNVDSLPDRDSTSTSTLSPSRDSTARGNALPSTRSQVPGTDLRQFHETIFATEYTCPVSAHCPHQPSRPRCEVIFGRERANIKMETRNQRPISQ